MKIFCLVNNRKLCYTLKSSILGVSSPCNYFLQLLSTMQLSQLFLINIHIINPSFSSNTDYLKFPSQTKGIITTTFTDFQWDCFAVCHSIYLTLLLPSGLQARAVTSFPVFSFGGKLQTR